MKKNLRFVGLDVHKESISVAVAESGREPARLLETVPAEEWLLLKVLDRLGPKARLRVCYEAGYAWAQNGRLAMVWRDGSMNRAFAAWSSPLRWFPFKRTAGSRQIVATRSG
jgi:hypothetical protein